MNQKTLIGGIIVVVVLILGFWYFTSGTPQTAMQDTATTTDSTTGTTNTTPSTTTSTNTFHSIFTQSGNHQCSYEQVGSSSKSTSVVYIADGKMRGEFRTTGETPTASLMIYSGGTLYSWKEGATTGTKTSISSLADLPQAIPTDLTSGAIFGVSSENVSWDCHDWAKDTTMFTLPSYVSFK